jgi:hypothetical protein
MDITQLILDDHHEQRKMFALLDEVDRDDTESLGPSGTRLRILLEVHAEAEEQLFYPRLLEVGEGATDADDAEEETEDAISDHNDIRTGSPRPNVTRSARRAGGRASPRPARRTATTWARRNARRWPTSVDTPTSPCAASSAWRSPRSRHAMRAASSRSRRIRTATSTNTADALFVTRILLQREPDQRSSRVSM